MAFIVETLGWIIFMHSGDLLSTDNNDTSNEYNQFDYKAAVVGNSRLGEIKVKAREVMAVGASALSKAVVEFHFTGLRKTEWKSCALDLLLEDLPVASSTRFPLKGNTGHSGPPTG